VTGPSTPSKPIEEKLSIGVEKEERMLRHNLEKVNSLIPWGVQAQSEEKIGTIVVE